MAAFPPDVEPSNPRVTGRSMLRFFNPAAEVTCLDFSTPERRDTFTTAHEVAMVDARTAGLEAWSLDVNGFRYITAPDFVNFRDPKAIQAEYVPKVLEAVRQEFPTASRVLWMQHMLRTESYPARTGGLSLPYARFAHSDYGPDHAPLFKQMLKARFGVPEAEAERSHVCILNLWAPVDRPAYKDPLALLDSRTAKQEGGTVTYAYGGPDTAVTLKFVKSASKEEKMKTAESKMPKFNDVPALAPLHTPDQRWVFCSDMTPQEAVLFKQYDSRPGAAVRATYHHAFPDSFHFDWEECPSRHSIECRIIITFDHQASPSSSKL